VRCAVEIIRQKGFEISEEAIKNGFRNAVKNTGLNGRWQILQERPKIICDTAHNKEGLTFAMAQLLKEPYKVLHMVFGVVNDKDVTSILPLLPKEAVYYFCKPNIPRGLDAEALRDIFITNGFIGDAYNSVPEALRNAKVHAAESDVIY